MLPVGNHQESSRIRGTWGEVLGGRLVLTGGGMGSSCRERFLPVNDTSADFGWWRTALCSPRRTSFSAVRPGALPASAFQLAIPWVCVQRKCGIGVFACIEEEGVWANWSHSTE